MFCCCSGANLCPTRCDPMDCSTSGFPVLHHLLSLLKLMSIELMTPSIHLILCRPPSATLNFPSIRVFSSESALCIRWPKYGASASASVLPVNTQDWFPLGLTAWISLQPRDSQESSPTPQLKSINSSALSFLSSPALTSIHDYWKDFLDCLDDTGKLLLLLLLSCFSRLQLCVTP